VVVGAKFPVSGEGEFLVAAVRRFFHPEDPPPDPSTIDWRELIRLSSDHAVTPMLYRALGSVAMPPDAAASFRSAFEQNTHWNLALSAELCRLAELFKEHEIAFVPLKGPALSEQLYGDLAMRCSGDLDWLVHQRDVLRVHNVLAARGYRVTSSLHWPCDSALLRCREAELSLVDEHSLSIDLHWQILPGYFPSAFDYEEVWQSLVSTEFCGRKIPLLCPEHLIHLLCAHGAKHAFERLGWICDVASCLKAFPDLRWAEVLAASTRAGTMRELLLGLKLAEDLFGIPLPAILPSDPAVEKLVRIVKNRVLAAAPIPIPESELIPFCLGLFESRRHRIRYLLGHFSPSEAEYQVLQLPPALYFLYYFFRPIRLIARYAVR
jgi:putative nucleotidyltransferase-like protein